MDAEGKEAESKSSSDAKADTKDGDGDEMSDPDVKVILLGDSAVGKTKMVERYLDDEFNPRQLSTYALTLFRKIVEVPTKPKSSLDAKEDEKDEAPASGATRKVSVDIWDT